MQKTSTRTAAIGLRKKGMSFEMISRTLHVRIPKSTLSYWFRDIRLSQTALDRKRKYMIVHLAKARKMASAKRCLDRNTFTKDLKRKNAHLPRALKQADTSKIVLTTIYACEGMKRADRACVSFGNSDPSIIRLFLQLLRRCYRVDENKFRCTIQCRADQEVTKLEQFWSEVTQIPKKQFYQSRIDERTRNKPSKKKNYKGVCRIDYFSAQIFRELLELYKLLTEGL